MDNPRKQGLESVYRPEERNRLLFISFVSAVSILFLFPIISSIAKYISVLWILIVVLYNVPPFRLKRYPVTDILFGGVGHFVPIFVLGYAVMTGALMPITYIILYALFASGCHLSGASFDIQYDTKAGIKNTTVLLQSVRIGLSLSAVIFVIAILYAFYLGLQSIALVLIILPLYLVSIVIRNNITEENSVHIFKVINTVIIAIGFIIGFIVWY